MACPVISYRDEDRDCGSGREMDREQRLIGIVDERVVNGWRT